MIHAYLVLTILAFGPQGQFPEKSMGDFQTEDACWQAINHFTEKLPRTERTTLMLSWRCGDAA